MAHKTLNNVFQTVTIFLISLKLGDSSSGVAYTNVSRTPRDLLTEYSPFDPVKYLMYDRRGNHWAYLPQDLILWNLGEELKVIIHGFNPNILVSGFDVLRRQHITILGQQYALRNSSINVVLVDWTAWATKKIGDYSQAAAKTRPAAQLIAGALMQWKKEGLFHNWNSVHIIGYSLGGHVAGMVGYLIQSATGERVRRITGLDPAGPKFDTTNGEAPDDLSQFLDRTDAEFVDIIHCNMGKGGEVGSALEGTYGSFVKAGHVDFYPNGGEHQFHVCDIDKDRRGCSHKFCVTLMAGSVRDKYGFPACPCESWNQFMDGSCGCINGDYSNAEYIGDAGDGLGMYSHSRYYALVTDQLPEESFG